MPIAMMKSAGINRGEIGGEPPRSAVAVLMAAVAVSILKLPLSSVVIVLLLTSKAGIATAPLIIVSAVVAYLTIQTPSAARDPAAGGGPGPTATGTARRPGPTATGADSGPPGRSA
jgi:H+/Cl- antiporter ClcA